MAAAAGWYPDYAVAAADDDGGGGVCEKLVSAVTAGTSTSQRVGERVCFLPPGVCPSSIKIRNRSLEKEGNRSLLLCRGREMARLSRREGPEGEASSLLPGILWARGRWADAGAMHFSLF